MNKFWKYGFPNCSHLTNLQYEIESESKNLNLSLHQQFFELKRFTWFGHLLVKFEWFEVNLVVKIGFLFGLLSLLLLANTCSAAADLTVTPVSDNIVEPGGTVYYYVNLSTTTDLGGNQTEYLSIRTDTKQSGWSYLFDPEKLILKNAGDSKTSILAITVPDTATEKTYYHVVVADGYLEIADNITIQVEHDESGINPDVNNIPEFPSIALPVAAVLGLVFAFGRKKE